MLTKKSLRLIAASFILFHGLAYAMVNETFANISDSSTQDVESSPHKLSDAEAYLTTLEFSFDKKYFLQGIIEDTDLTKSFLSYVYEDEFPENVSAQAFELWFNREENSIEKYGLNLARRIKTVLKLTKEDFESRGHEWLLIDARNLKNLFINSLLTLIKSPQDLDNLIHALPDLYFPGLEELFNAFSVDDFIEQNRKGMKEDDLVLLNDLVKISSSNMAKSFHQKHEKRIRLNLYHVFMSHLPQDQKEKYQTAYQTIINSRGDKVEKRRRSPLKKTTLSPVRSTSEQSKLSIKTPSLLPPKLISSTEAKNQIPQPPIPPKPSYSEQNNLGKKESPSQPKTSSVQTKEGIQSIKGNTESKDTSSKPLPKEKKPNLTTHNFPLIATISVGVMTLCGAVMYYIHQIKNKATQNFDQQDKNMEKNLDSNAMTMPPEGENVS